MLSVKNLRKTFVTRRGSIKGVAGLDLDVPQGMLYTLLGPSGCGKTTTMRCIAGLEDPEEGEVAVGNQVLFSSVRKINIPVNQRRIGMVFQSYALWPHMDVFNNVAYPLQVRRLPVQKIQQRVEHVLSLVGLGEAIRRPVTELSGGQQQRVAVARAIVNEVNLLLMDEPLSNLDVKIREQVRVELRSIQRRLAITTLYVTHDQQEAMALADFIVLMDNGVVVESGAPDKLYTRPRKRFTADFLGSANFINIQVLGIETAEDKGVGSCEFGAIRFSLENGVRPEVGCSSILTIRPENIKLFPKISETDKENPNFIGGNIKEAMFLGSFINYEVATREKMFTVRTTLNERYAIDDLVYMHIPPEQCCPVEG